MFLRLRQLCLVAHDLEPVVTDLEAIFAIAVCHRDPAVAMFGLHNALLPIGTSFIEIVAPVEADTTAGRYLERRQGDGGYMVILDTADVTPWQAHVDRIGVRVAAPLSIDIYRGLQLHPRDTGGALLEINCTEGNGPIDGLYHPAGPHWQGFVRTGVVKAVTGAELQSADPARLAARWGEILQRPAQRAGDQWRVAVDNAELRFVPATDGRGEGLGGIDVEVSDLEALRRRAADRGRALVDGRVEIGGVRFNLHG
ncbi:VOC family protein [Chelatococcus reniformis]|uniref:Glyoxalase-like domain-containing protein n=1 Tax=Chelatococcus reniformis TaxID=1494448 RepID=A0A916UHY2_9HYPH|nr:VOC family protein [Chelatococcus reniformis]GGC72609.1 hypothetical protein GCM10010994_33740 [Chelatococcus reniformis]